MGLAASASYPPFRNDGPEPDAPTPRVTLGAAALVALSVHATPAAAQATARCGSDISGSFPTGVLCQPAIGTAAVLGTLPGATFGGITASSLRAFGRQASASVTVDGATITNSATVSNAHGVQAQVTGAPGDATVTFSGGATGITLTGATALDGANALNNTAGAASISVTAGTALQITNLVNGNDHDGLDANNTGGGNASIVHNGTGQISVVGGNGVHGRAVGAGTISATVGSGVSIIVDNTNGVADPADPGLEAGKANHAGIWARTVGSGAITIDNGASIRSIDENAFGILGWGGTGAVSIRNTGAITTDGTAGSALRAAATTSGDITIVNRGALTTTGIQGHGIYVSGGATDGNIAVENHGTLTVGSPANAGDAEGSRAIYVIARGASNAQVTGSGDIAVRGAPTSGRGYGIIMSAVNGTSMVDYSGNITVVGNGAGAIRAHSNTNATTVDYHGGKLETFNANANGIYATNDSATAPVTVRASGTIVTHADNGGGDGSGGGSFGLQATTLGGPVSIDFQGGQIDVNGSGAGIVAGSGFSGGTGAGSVTVRNAGAILARGATQRGMRSFSSTGAQQITNTGSIQTRGVADSQGILAQATAAAPITVANSGGIQTVGNNASGIEATTQGTVDVTSTGPISAGWGTSAGIRVGGAAQAVQNGAGLSALSDVAVAADNGAAGSLVLRNTGAMTGVVTAATSATQIANAGAWNLRRFIDGSGTGVRDTWQLAVANLGASGANSVDNSGTLSLAPQPVGTAATRSPADAIATFDATGAYLPLGQSANAPVLGGAVQGQLLGVRTFTNSGTVDVAGGGTAVGNVLVITGGQTPGADGGGTFVSNGGALKLNTVLNEGGAASRSDMLVVDATATGPGGPTRIAVNNVGGAGALTNGAGIALVELTNKAPSASDPNAFALNGRAVAGVYEYRLFRGDQAGANPDVWYLRSERSPEPTPTPQALYRPEVAAYLANQRLAGQMFVHSLHDRLGEPQYVESQGFDRAEDKPRAGWLRAVGNWQGSRSKDGVYKTSTDSFLLHGGLELAKWHLGSETDRAHAGLMASYGNARTDADAAGNAFHARGKVEGWSVGAYGTWYQNDENRLGAYVDTWFQYGWFTNRVEGDLLPSVRYHAQGLALSGEAGYAVPLRDGWVVEPQAQLIYVDYNEDDVTEPNGTRVNGADSSGVITRLGVRTHRTYDRADGRKYQPYLTVNWWYSDTDSNIAFNQIPVGTLYPHNRMELKLGLNADLGKGRTAWANVSGSWGQQNYYQYAARVGFKYTWK